MKSNLYAIFAATAILIVGGFASTVKAQIPSNTVVTADVPFAFSVRGKILPAGKYVIRPTEDLSDSDMTLEIVMANSKSKPIVFETYAATDKSATETGGLVFDKVGETYFLSQIFVANNPSGNELAVSKAQKTLEAKKVAKKKVRVGGVAPAAKS